MRVGGEENQCPVFSLCSEAAGNEPMAGFIIWVVELYTYETEACMGRYCCSQLFLNVAFCLFISCVAEFRPLVIGGFFKLVASLVFACLLAFVVIHSPHICKLVADCLRPLAIPLFSFAVDRRWTDRSQTNFVVPNEPSLAALFQRPPPIFSL